MSRLLPVAHEPQAEETILMDTRYILDLLRRIPADKGLEIFVRPEVKTQLDRKDTRPATKEMVIGIIPEFCGNPLHVMPDQRNSVWVIQRGKIATAYRTGTINEDVLEKLNQQPPKEINGL